MGKISRLAAAFILLALATTSLTAAPAHTREEVLEAPMTPYTGTSVRGVDTSTPAPA